MTQIATVTALPAASGGPVEVSVVRQTACGHSCENCGGCAAGKNARMVVKAEADIPLQPGDRVEIASGNGVLGAAALVYLGPLFLFLLGYLLAGALSEGARYLCGGLGFILGLAGAMAWDRRVKRSAGIRYRVTRKL